MCVWVLLLGQTMNNLATSTTSQDNKQDVEMWNYGLVIWNSTWAAFMDLGEIPLVILPSVLQLRSSGKSGGNKSEH